MSGLGLVAAPTSPVWPPEVRVCPRFRVAPGHTSRPFIHRPGHTHRAGRLRLQLPSQPRNPKANSILPQGRRMNLNEEHEALLIAQGEAHLIPGHTSGTSTPAAKPAPRKMGYGRKVVVALLLTVVLVPPLGGFYSYFSGIPLHLLASSKEAGKALEPAALPSVTLVSGQAHTLKVPDEVCSALGIRKDGQNGDAVAVAWLPKTMRPLVLPGSTAFDPTRLARIRARFAPARVVQLAQVWDYSRKTGQTEYRELRPGDSISKGDLLGVFYSLDVGSKKNDLLDALVQLELDQKILDEAQKHVEAVPQVFMLSTFRAVQGDRNAINRALNNLKDRKST